MSEQSPCEAGGDPGDSHYLHSVRLQHVSSVSRQVFVPSNILTNTFVFDTVSFLSILTLMVFIGESWTLFTARLIELDSAEFNQAWKAGSFFPLFGPIISGFLDENISQIEIIIVFIYDHLFYL